MLLTSSVPCLDECGHVYVAGAGPRGECLRLNPSASRVWRARVGSLSERELAGLPAAEQRFLRMLLDREVLGWSTP